MRRVKLNNETITVMEAHRETIQAAIKRLTDMSETIMDQQAKYPNHGEGHQVEKWNVLEALRKIILEWGYAFNTIQPLPTLYYCLYENAKDINPNYSFKARTGALHFLGCRIGFSEKSKTQEIVKQADTQIKIITDQLGIKLEYEHSGYRI